jgi:hypothetical protein
VYLHACETLRYVSSLKQLEHVHGVTCGGTTGWLYYESCLQGMHTNQIIKIQGTYIYMAFTSLNVEIKSPYVDVPFYFWIYGHIYHLLLPLYQNRANKLGYEQLYIFYSDETTNQTKGV